MTFVEAYDTETGKKLEHPVPEHYIGHPLLGRRLRRTPSSVAAEKGPVQIPEGQPNDSWTHAQIDAYASVLELDLGDASTKAQKVAAIDELTNEPDPTETPDTGNKE